MIWRCQTNLFIHTYYKESTGFTSLTQTFLFCTCIPALHDCSRCGLRDFGCWQPRKCMIFIVVDCFAKVMLGC